MEKWVISNGNDGDIWICDPSDGQLQVLLGACIEADGNCCSCLTLRAVSSMPHAPISSNGLIFCNWRLELYYTHLEVRSKIA